MVGALVVEVLDSGLGEVVQCLLVLLESGLPVSDAESSTEGQLLVVILTHFDLI